VSVVPARFYRPQKLVVFGLDAGESLAARLVASLLRRQVPFQTSSAGSETPAPRVRHPKRPRCFWRRVVAATTALHRRSNRGPRSRGAIPLADSPTAPPKVRSDKRQIRRAWCHHVRRCGPRLYDCHCCHQSPSSARAQGSLLGSAPPNPVHLNHLHWQYRPAKTGVKAAPIL